MKGARAVLVLWCKLSVASPWVRQEAAWAKAQGSYIPVWLEDAALPDAFRDDHTLALAHWNGEPQSGALMPLLRAIGQRVGRSPQQDFETLAREQQTWERYSRPALASFALQPGREPPLPQALKMGEKNLWDSSTRPTTRHILKGHAAAVTSAAFSPDGARIVTGSDDNTARVWDAASGQSLLTLRGHTGWVNSAAFSLDGARIVTGSFDNTARVWDARSGQSLLTLQGRKGSVRSAAFSPDSARIVTGSHDITARVWDARSGQSLLILQGHTRSVFSAAFSPDCARIVTGSADETARIWDAASGQELLTLQGHTNSVLSAAFSPDGARIVTGSGDGTARVWEAE